MPPLLPEVLTAHSGYAAPAFAQQRRIYPPGSQEDIEQKIHHFYEFWFQQSGTVASSLALQAHSIDLVMEAATAEESQVYNVEEVYNASGIVKRGFYPDAGSKLHPERCSPLEEYFVSGLSSSHIFARCPPTKPRGTEAQKEKRQAMGRRGSRTSTAVLHREPSKTIPSEMVQFPALHDTQGGVRPHLNSDSHPPSESWMQLQAQPDRVDERMRGSPSTPLISVLRLNVVVNAYTTKSVLVVFRIVRNGDGSFRPWRKEDRKTLIPPLWLPDRPSSPPFIDLQALPPVPHISIQSLMGSPHDRTSLPRLGLLEPPFASSRAHVAPPASRGLEDYHRSLAPDNVIPPRRPEQHYRSLNHRQRKIYQQDFANGGQDRLANF
ncbi:hypothetical protein JCM5353_004300 [Sporobolomyces roseus]